MVSPLALPHNGYSVRARLSRKNLAAYTFLTDFSVTKLTPTFVTNLGYNFFFMSAAIDIGGMAVFSM